MFFSFGNVFLKAFYESVVLENHERMKNLEKIKEILKHEIN
jgi:hypothetical protein